MPKGKNRTIKPRSAEIRIDAGRPLTITGLTAPGNGPMQFFGVDGEPISDIKVEVGTVYERTGKGSKVLTRARADPLAMVLTPTTACLTTSVR